MQTTFSPEEIQEVIAKARDQYDEYIMEHLAYLRTALARHDKHKSPAKRAEDWRSVEREARKVLKWLQNLKGFARTDEAGGGANWEGIASSKSPN